MEVQRDQRLLPKSTGESLARPPALLGIVSGPWEGPGKPVCSELAYFAPPACHQVRTGRRGRTLDLAGGCGFVKETREMEKEARLGGLNTEK